VTTDNVTLHAEMGNIPSIVAEDLYCTSQHSPLRFTAEFFVPANYNPTEFNVPNFSFRELLGLSFLKESEDGTKIRAKVVNKINDMDAQNHKNIKMLMDVGEDGYEESMAYIELCDIIEDQHDDEYKNPERHWVFKDILG
jgi:hypothetical protein